MRNILNPAWLFITNTVPILVMAFIYYGNFAVIESLLTEENLVCWQTFALMLGILWLISLGYAATCLVWNRRISPFYSLFVLLTFIPFLYWYCLHVNDLIPWRVPMWLMPEDITMYAGTFLMPAMAHALFSLVVVFTSNASERKPLYSFLVAVFCPLCWYLFYVLLLPLWQSAVDSRYGEHVLIVMLMVSSVIFLYALTRGFYIVSSRPNRVLNYPWLWRGLIALILPITGLVVNTNFNFFGNFNGFGFYALAVVNGVAIMLPDTPHKLYRIILFGVRSITFSFTFYFFIVFLPYLPLAVIAVIVVGAGFLMLTPLALMVAHCRIISTDMIFLKRFYTTRSLYGVLLAGVATLPLAVTWVYLNEKHTLNKALAHIYTPDYHEHQNVSAGALERVLKTVRNTKGERWEKTERPFLSSYYTWLVLDHLTLSDAKINMLERVFNGVPVDTFAIVGTPPFPGSDKVAVTSMQAASVYDARQQAWVSSIALEINNPTNAETEFSTSFQLPTGSWISNYYLWIGDKKTPGILAEKKTAMWVYQQIVNTRRDPGILYYHTGNTVALRVFPLLANETRKTSLELLHKDPIHFRLNGRDIVLGEDTPMASAPLPQQAGQAVYIPARVKQQLQPVRRTPRPYFIIDCAEQHAHQPSTAIADIEAYAQAQHLDLNTATFVLNDAYTTRFDNWADAKEKLLTGRFQGGFFLERGLKQALLSAYPGSPDEYPHIIVVSRALDEAIITEDLANLQWAFPDSDFFFELKGTSLVPHNLTHYPPQPVMGTLPQLPHTVAAWPDAQHPQAYVRLDDEASIIYQETNAPETAAEPLQHDWHSALALQGAWMAHVAHPERTAKAWLQLVKGSFQAQVMTPVTSYIVLENEAQRLALLKKQQDVLNANPSLDAGEEMRMSEPGFWLMALLACLTAGVAYRKTLRAKLSLLLQ